MIPHRHLVVALLLGLVPLLATEAAPAQDVAAYQVYNFRVTSAGEATRLVIETTGAPRYRDDFEPRPPHLAIELIGAVADLPLRAYEDIHRGGVRRVTVSAPAPGRVRLDVFLSSVRNYAAFQQGNDIVVSFENPGGSFPAYVANPAGRAPAPRPTPPPAGAVVTREVEAPGGASGMEIRQDEGLPGVDGEPVTLSFQGADVNTVIRAFGEIADRSIVAGDVGDVTITADVRNEPWDEALVAIMQANGLDVRMVNGIVRVDSIENLREAETLIDLRTRVVQLDFVAAPDVVTVVQPLLSERGSVTADEKTNSIVVTDVPDRIREAADVVQELDVQTPQVTIKAKIVFVNKVDLNELGVKWKAENLGDFTTDTHVQAETDGEIADPFLDLSIGTLASGLNVGGLLQALERRELADVQAEPQTTVLNNLQAEIFVGERTPIRVLDVGADTPEARASVELIETGIILNVTPHITSNGKVLMNVLAERSGVQVTDPQIGVTFNTQRANSQILVNDGETAVIGGLTVQDISEVRTGVPVLKDIPVLGALFRSERKRSEKRDLLIFVTPYIVPIEEPEREVVTIVCLEDQGWYRTDEPIVHNGERWLEFGAPQRMSRQDLIEVGNYRGVPVYTTVENAAVEIYLPLCAPGLYQPYRQVAAIRGTTG
ncbi:MAG: secretin N-terminal domain-containing protein [Gemmatimonadota bacterium]|nr:secretin N-terminal domain-containing protein [Gemmatimonadota bacterium]